MVSFFICSLLTAHCSRASLRESRRSCHHPSAEINRAAAHLDNESRRRHRLRKQIARPCPERGSSRRTNLRHFYRHPTAIATVSHDVRQTLYAIQRCRSRFRQPPRRSPHSLPSDRVLNTFVACRWAFRRRGKTAALRRCRDGQIDATCCLPHPARRSRGLLLHL